MRKVYVPESYYHIYNRGVNKEAVYREEEDFAIFLSLLKRYLGREAERKPNRTWHPNFYNSIELLAFCLMDNHFHLFIYQQDAEAMAKLMTSLTVSYGMYFNKKYGRVGPIFQRCYRAVRMTDESQFLHISRYIHMNPAEYETYEWSSLPYYLQKKHASWIRPARILEVFKDQQTDYRQFLSDYKNRRDELVSLKNELADT